ncbi:MAG: hypothetical protein ACR2PG_11475 [Hyphomicrobiaceae bacterium]
MTNTTLQIDRRYRFARPALSSLITIYIASMVILVASDFVADLLAFFASSKALLWTFAASSISSIVGFAFSPIAGSLLFHIVPDHLTAVSILLICSITLQFYSVVALASHIRWNELTPFLVGGLIGLLPGV